MFNIVLYNITFQISVNAAGLYKIHCSFNPIFQLILLGDDNNKNYPPNGPNINNNNLQYPQTMFKPYMNGYPSVSMPDLSTQQGFLNQIPMLPSNLMCPQQMRPMPVNHPVMLTNKLKAQPTLISISSARDHKFMPY